MQSSMPKVLHRLGGRALLQHVIETAGHIHARRVLVITGEGKAFCSGADLKAGLIDPDLGNVLRKTYNPMILALRG